jgi:hypothetical protein
MPMQRKARHHLTRFCFLALAALFTMFIYSKLKGGIFGQNAPTTYTSTTNASYQFNTLRHPTGLVAVQLGSTFYLFIADSSNNLIRQFVVPLGGSGTLSTVAGNGTAGYVDGAVGSAEFNDPTDLIGTTGSYWGCGCTGPYCCHYFPYTKLYVNDAQNYVVREVCIAQTLNGPCGNQIDNVSTVAGNHTQGYYNSSSLQSEFSPVFGLSGKAPTPSSTNPFYLADGLNNVVRLWDGSNVTTFAGSGSRGYINGYRTTAEFGTPVKSTWDANGNMYVTDSDNFVIRKIDTAGNVTTFAGTGQAGYVDGAGSQAQFHFPLGIVFNPADNYLYVADGQNNVIRRIDLAGNVSTYAGTGTGGLTNGSLSQAQFSGPTNLVILSGFMYVSDSLNNVIRRIDMSAGTISTYIS